MASWVHNFSVFSSFTLGHKLTPLVLFVRSVWKQNCSNSPHSNSKAMKYNGRLNSSCNFFCKITFSNILKYRGFYDTIWFTHQWKINIYNNTEKEEFNLYWNKYYMYKAHIVKMGHNKWKWKHHFAQSIKKALDTSNPT